MANVIKNKRGTAAQWTSLNPTLAEGELGLETDTLKIKFGDGVTAWNSLSYAGSTADLSNYYTKTEVDELLEDVGTSFTPIVPLEFLTETEGGSYNIDTSQGRIDNVYRAFSLDGLYDGTTLVFRNSAIGNSPSTLAEFFTGNCSYFDIPTTTGKRIANKESFTDRIYLPTGQIDSTYWPVFIWGHKGVNNEFTPVVLQRGVNGGTNMYGGFVSRVTNKGTNGIGFVYSTFDTTYTTSSGGAWGGWRAFLQYTPNSSVGTLKQTIDRAFPSGSYNRLTNSTTSSTIIEKAKTINTVRIFGYTSNAATVYTPTTASRYTVNDVDTGWNINDKPKVTRSLSLKYDNNTIILNSNNELEVNRGSGYEVGDVIWRLIPTQDSGKHLLDGALLQRDGINNGFIQYIAGLVTDYPDLFVTENDWQTSVSTYGVCGKFVYDSVNNTVRLPKVTGIIEGTIDVNALGDLVEAGLPNITGSFAANTTNTPHFSGAIYSDEPVAGGSFSAATNVTLVKFNASRSSSIYGNSLAVQPQTIKGYFYIVTATSAKTDIQIDIDNVVTDLNGKCDVDGTNATFAHITETYVNGSDWNRVYSDGWCEQGGKINATANGTTVTFLKPYIDTNYTGNLIHAVNTYRVDANAGELAFVPLSNSQVTLYSGITAGVLVQWRACGYIR